MEFDPANPMTGAQSLPAHLNGTSPQGVRENEVIAQFEIGSLRNFVYLILDWESRSAAIVDPQRDLSRPREVLDRWGFKLERILLTHSHHDHVAGVRELMQDSSELKLSLHERDLHRIESLFSGSRASTRLELLRDNQEIRVGRTQVQALHTPGHSAGEMCFLVRGDRPYLLTGDTLFIRDCGRTDFADGSNPEMFRSLQRIKKLPPETVILPGHHYAPECASILATELRSSPPLLCQSVEELEALP